jgi:hypothetical protein
MCECIKKLINDIKETFAKLVAEVKKLFSK